MALAVDFALVVLRGEVDGHREFRLALQDLCRVRGSRDRIAHSRERGGEEGMMRVVRPCDPRKSLGGFGVFLGAIAGAPEVAPEALWVIRVKAHRLLDPVDAFLRPSKPRQKFALLHHNQVVVGVERERPLLMIRGLIMIVAVQVQRGENPVHVAVVIIERQRDLQLRGHLLEGDLAIGAPIINSRRRHAFCQVILQPLLVDIAPAPREESGPGTSASACHRSLL